VNKLQAQQQLEAQGTAVIKREVTVFSNVRHGPGTSPLAGLIEMAVAVFRTCNTAITFASNFSKSGSSKTNLTTGSTDLDRDLFPPGNVISISISIV
jgi:hypothetical protein